MRRITLALGLAVLLSACASAEKEMAEAGNEPMTASEVREAIADTTQYGVSREGNNYAIYRSPDGEMRGKAWGNWGEATDTGSWSVNDDGLYCARWSEWRDGREGCWRLYDNDGELVYAAVSGRAQDTETAAEDLAEGNPEDL